MCKSRTGSGKTLAFAIPIIEALDRQSGGEAVQKQRGGRGRHFSRGAYGRLPRAMCVAPTRELAKQVCTRVRLVSMHTYAASALSLSLLTHLVADQVLSQLVHVAFPVCALCVLAPEFYIVLLFYKQLL